MRTSITVFLLVIVLSFEIIQNSELENSIYCESYNGSLCNEENKEGNTDGCVSKQEKCGHEGPNEYYRCFTLWEHNVPKNVSTIQMKGCFLNNKDCYKESHCTQRNKNSLKRLFFCCCNGNLCNQNFTYPNYLLISQKPKLKMRVFSGITSIISLNEIIILGVCVIIFLTIILLSCFGWCFYHCSKQNDVDMERASYDECPFTDSQECNLNTEDRLNRLDNSPAAIASIKLIERKASGRFGSVWMAYRSTEVVAVKIFPLRKYESWEAELKVYRLAFLEHDNILRFIAAGRRGTGLYTQFWLVMEYYEKGSLCDYLTQNLVTWNELCKVAICITRGLEHLHQETGRPGNTIYKPPIAHRDFKSKNILLKANLHACVADFGLALIFEPGLQGTPECGGNDHCQAGTPCYMAPELLGGFMEFRKQAFLAVDMYAYAIVLWELVSRCTENPEFFVDYQVPFEKELGLEFAMSDLCRYVIQENGRPTMPDSWREQPGLSLICDIIEECWDKDSDARLSSSCAYDRISVIKNVYTNVMISESETSESSENSFKFYSR